MIRVIIGIIITGFGLVGLFKTTYRPISTYDKSLLNIIENLSFDNIIELVVYSIIVGIGSMIFIWGCRSQTTKE